jgi:hypothetical protein
MEELVVEGLRVLVSLMFAEGLPVVGADEESPPVLEMVFELPKDPPEELIVYGDSRQILLGVGPEARVRVGAVRIVEVGIQKEGLSSLTPKASEHLPDDRGAGRRGGVTPQDLLFPEAARHAEVVGDEGDTCLVDGLDANGR